MDENKYWLSDCRDYGIVQTGDEYFETYYRLYSSLGNHDSMWYRSYASARNFLKVDHGMESRMRKATKEEFEKAI